jgi:hypothetical protein
MASAIARNLEADLPLRKPPACEPRGSDMHRTETVRQAFGADVVGSPLSPRAQLGYRVLVDHINRGRDPRRSYDGQVFLTDETFAIELGGVSKRQVQRIRSELLAGCWICLPHGDAGGRGNATIWYHLHPDGCACPRSALTPLKQRAAAAQANARRAAVRQQEHAGDRRKDDNPVALSRSELPKDDSVVVLLSALKDDRGVMLSPKRMTESTEKDDQKDAKDDKTGVAYKEELIQELIPEPNSTTATNKPAEFPPEFARLMDQEITLDDGALRRLWQEAHAVVSDATGDEIHHFFQERARSVYRNRKLDNPTGLMLSTIHDWFPQRRVLGSRKTLHDDAEEAGALQTQLAEQLAELRLSVAPLHDGEKHADAGQSKGVRNTLFDPALARPSQGFDCPESRTRRQLGSVRSIIQFDPAARGGTLIKAAHSKKAHLPGIGLHSRFRRDQLSGNKHRWRSDQNEGLSACFTAMP